MTISIQILCRFKSSQAPRFLGVSKISIQILCRFKTGQTANLVRLAKISIQILCRFKVRVILLPLLVHIFQYKSCVGSRMLNAKQTLKLRISIQILCRFKTIVTCSLIQRINFNTNLVSVQGDSFFCECDTFKFQYKSCVGSSNFYINVFYLLISFQYKSCVGSS